MKAIKRSKLLATVLLLLSMTFLPQVSASTTISLGDITAAADPADWGDNSVGAIPAKGSFDYFFTFTLGPKSSYFDLTSTVLTAKLEQGPALSPTKGTSFSYFALEDGTGNVLELGSVIKDPIGRYTASLPEDFWLTPGSYKLELKGVSSGVSASFGGSISVSPVPEADSWALLLLGLPMLSWVVRRQQA